MKEILGLALLQVVVALIIAPECEASPLLPSLGGVSPSKQPGLGCYRKSNETSLVECFIRTLNHDNLPDLTSRQELSTTRSLRIKCSDKFFFDSFLAPNQTLFQMTFLEEVSIESCKIRALPSNVWASLSYLRKLRISSRNSDWSTSVSLLVDNNAFQGLNQLTSLDLSQNNIWSLPETIFCPLRSLQKLNVSWNRLSELEELNPGLPEANFCSLNGVTIVDAGYNQLRRVGKIVKWRKIQELKLENNFIEELQDEAFAELKELRSVNLSSNRLVALPPSIFKFNGVSLREVYLANNSISALAPAVFSGLNNLLLLDVSRNTLTSQWIREKMFNGLVRLLGLRLSFNQLSSIDEMIFADLINLQTLNLDHNRLESVAPGAFRMNANLRVLDLSHNRLVRLDEKVFGGLGVLRQLYLDHNKIRGVEDGLLENATNLQDFGLADNLLQEVPSALRSLHSLQTLDLGENRITTMTNTSFQGLSQLFGLRLVDNRLSEIPTGFCNPLTKLRVLNLAQNRLRTVSPSAFETCPELRALRLDTNLLEDLPQNLFLPSLLWLNISENRLQSVNYRSIPSTVEWLDLSHNQIKSITTQNSKSQLRVLDLSFNQLTMLDSTMIPASLETLRLNQNKVSSVASDAFLRSSRLRRVELTQNQLQTLTLTSLRFPPIASDRPLPEFFLGNNPFTCDCNLEWLTRINSLTPLRQHPRIIDLDNLTCNPILGNSNSSILIRTAPPDQFLCQYKSHCFALCHCCDFDACDCEMTCPQNCSCYHDTTWGRNIVQCSNTSLETVPHRIPMDATEIHLDGNNLAHLSSHIFIGKKNLKTLFLNQSRIESIRNKTFNGLKSLQVLHLQGNLLMELQGFEFKDLDNLRELYLQNNLIRNVGPETFASLQYLQVLRLDGNFLMRFSVWELGRNQVLQTVSLFENPWSCECDFASEFRNWVYSHRNSVEDWSGLSCRKEETIFSLSAVCEQFTEMTKEDSNVIQTEVISKPTENQELTRSTNSEEGNNGILWTLLLISTCFVLLLLVLVVLFRKEIKERLMGKGAKGDAEEKLFDAYFLYSRKDEDLVLEKLTPELETGPNYFRLCLHYRDLCLNPENPWNFEMIQGACDASKRVVLVVSSAFFHNEYSGNAEFRESMDYVLGRSEILRKLILVVVPPCGRETLGQFLNLNSSISKTSVLEYTDKNFWSRFKLALPTPVLGGALDHPMLIPATYTISRSTGGEYNSRGGSCRGNIIHHGGNMIQGGHLIHQGNFIHQGGNFIPTGENVQGNMIQGGGSMLQHQQQQGGLPSYQQSLKHLPPPPLPPPWQSEGNTVHPTPPPPPFVSFNESFKRHQLMSQQQALRLNNHPRVHSHSHQDSNCSNASNNSRRPLNASSYSSSVETNLSSSSNEELDHVYSTLDSPMQSRNSNNCPGLKLINPYSPTNINNNGDPTMYFV